MRKALNISFLFLIFVVTFHSVTSAGTNPKREFRAVWVATVANIDWPYRYDSPAIQKQKLIQLFDNMKNCGMNAIIFQVRPECDALYESSYEPWSYWLTAQQGTAPNPYYDPLEFAIQEAHKRGMELHAWFNPYRAERSVGYFSLHSSHVVIQHPEWVLTFGSLKMLDPGLPMTRDYVTDVIMEVVNNYDIDGVHFDDYFYPYEGTAYEDTATFANYSRGFTDIGDWRRDNVNLLVEMVFDSIKAVKSHVKFGISPFGIWKNGVPEGIIAYIDAYDDIYCDGLAWLNRRIVDYLTPQIYWQFGYDQDYGKLMPWWASQTDDRHIYPGHAAYKINGWGLPREMPNQVRANRETDRVFGSVYFSARQIVNNPLGFRDSLRQDLYKYPALKPVMTWLDSIPPETPQNLIATDANDGITLEWDAPVQAIDGDSAHNYVIYRIPAQDTINIDQAENIIIILPKGTISFNDNSVSAEQGYSYLVTSLDRLHNESNKSNRVYMTYTAISEPMAQIPAKFRLEQNFPNPFNPVTNIEFSIDISGHTKLEIFNVLGQTVSVLLNDDLQEGVYQISFDGSDLSSGIYFYRLTNQNRLIMKKMVLVK